MHTVICCLGFLPMQQGLLILTRQSRRVLLRKISVTIAKYEELEELKESEVIEVCDTAGLVGSDIIRIFREKLGERHSAARPSAVVLVRSQAHDVVTDLVNNVVFALTWLWRGSRRRGLCLRLPRIDYVAGPGLGTRRQTQRSHTYFQARTHGLFTRVAHRIFPRRRHALRGVAPSSARQRQPLSSGGALARPRRSGATPSADTSWRYEPPGLDRRHVYRRAAASA